MIEPWTPITPIRSPISRAAAVSQKNAGGVPVVEQEARQATRQRHGQDRDADVLVVNRHQGQGPAHQQPDPRGQAVHAVDQVPDVHAAQEPEHRHDQAGQRHIQGQSQQAELEVGLPQVEVQAEHIDGLDPDAPQVERQHGQGLPQQLDPRPDRSGVVDEANNQDDQRGAQDRPLMMEIRQRQADESRRS